MVALSNPLIDTLVDLVENKLLAISSEGRERCAEYRSLQDCRYTLLAMIAKANEATSFPSGGHGRTTKVGYLRAIEGGKA